MPSFFLTSSSNVAQTLSVGQTGSVALGVTLFVTTGSAVASSGDSIVAVLGAVGSGTGPALSYASTVNNADVLVGAQGSAVSLLDAAIAGTLVNRFQLNNAGLIEGGAEAIRLTAIGGTGILPDFHLANSGTIQSSGDSSAEATIEIVQTIGAVVNIGNAGLVLNGGAGDAISVRFGRLNLVNTGTIQATGGLAIGADASFDRVTNSGTIMGTITLGAGSDSVRNQGVISGEIFLSEGSDRLVNTGEIVGNVSLGGFPEASPTSETVVNAGSIIGELSLGDGNDIYRSRGGTLDGGLFGGAGNDTYILDDASFDLDDAGGLDKVIALVDFALGAGIETLELRSATGLRGLGNSGDNDLFGSRGDDTLRGEAGNDTLDGRGGENRLAGGAGADRIESTGENETLLGGAGDDVFVLTTGNATIEGGSGSDLLSFFASGLPVQVNLALGSGSIGNDARLTLSQIEDVTGSIGDDILLGDAQSNRLSGGLGRDVLRGIAGADLLTGGNASDTLTGGSGVDSFLYLAFGDSAVGAEDVITDFNGQDVIDISALAAITGDPASGFAFLGTAAFTGQEGELRHFFDAGSGHTVIELRAKGSVVNDMVIFLTGNYTLAADDFVL